MSAVRIGPYTLPNQLILAPMAGVTDRPFRQLCRRLGAGLVVAEMLGVKSGLGWYLTWAQGWASYPNMYGALIIMALLFSGVISLLFVLRDRVLSWQKGIVKW